MCIRDSSKEMAEEFLKAIENLPLIVEQPYAKDSTVILHMIPRWFTIDQIKDILGNSGLEWKTPYFEDYPKGKFPGYKLAKYECNYLQYKETEAKSGSNIHEDMVRVMTAPQFPQCKTCDSLMHSTQKCVRPSIALTKKGCLECNCENWNQRGSRTPVTNHRRFAKYCPSLKTLHKKYMEERREMQVTIPDNLKAGKVTTNAELGEAWGAKEWKTKTLMSQKK